MNFSTSVQLNPKSYPTLSYSTTMMSLGSCFSDHIGKKLDDAKFSCLVNPYGVLYNPASIADALQEIIEHKAYTDTDVFYYHSLWHSWMHHGDFSFISKDDTLKGINSSIDAANEALKNLDVLFITFGTAGVYCHNQENRVVSNCHKVPNSEFTRTQLSVSDIVQTYTELLDQLFLFNPNVKVVLSVSPIRHIRDGLVENQRSKSTLILAISELLRMYPEALFYFPAYEIFMDELRDYRFYADDMVHPSSLAISYVWERFQSVFFEKETIGLINECLKIRKAIEHRPINPNTPDHTSFLEHLILKMESISKKNPTLDFRKEIEQCLIQLNK